MQCGHLFNATGTAIDGMAQPETAQKLPIHRAVPTFDQLSSTTEIFYTGIKVIELFVPYVKYGKIGLFCIASVGKTVLIMELIDTIAKSYNGLSEFTVIRERTCEGNDFLREMIETGEINYAKAFTDAREQMK